MKKKKQCKVYVYRNTVEFGYKGMDFLAELTVDEDWLEEYVTRHKKFSSLFCFLDFYTCDDTKDLYKLASSEERKGIISEMTFQKPTIHVDADNNSIFSLAYDAMRILTIAGLRKKGRRVFCGTLDQYKDNYLKARDFVSRYVDIVKEDKH